MKKNFIITAMTIVASPAVAEPLHLTCMGAGSANRITTTTVQAQDNRGNSASADAYGQRSVDFDDQVDVEIGESDSGRIRLPRAMLPPLHGGEGGWFELKKVQKTDAEIVGVAQVNILNSPKVRVDRMTGRITINGKAGDYSGECRRVEPEKAVPKF